MPEDAITTLLARLETIERKLDELLREEKLPDKEWLSIEEVCALTGLSDDHVRRHVTAGLLPVCNQGTFEKPYYRIRRSDVDAWMAERMRQPGPAPKKRKVRPGGYVSRHHGKEGG